MQDTNTTKPDLNEIASTHDGRDITRGYIDALSYIEPQDRVLQRAGGLEGYEELLKDDQVWATFSQRRNAVISRPWTVQPGGNKRIDKQAALLIEETLKKLDWDSITDHMLFARFYGYAVAEVLWKICDGAVRVNDVRVRDRRRFVFDKHYALKMLTTTNPNGEDLPPCKFWTASVGASHADEPYGLGLGHALYWPVFFKRNGARFWAVYLEKFGAPTAKGQFPRGTDTAERSKLLSTLSAISTDAGIIVPEGVEIELLEASRGGTASYENWMNYWDAAIAKVVLGQTMTTDNGSSYSQASVHYDVRQDIVAADADLVCQSANKSWVRWLVDYNYPGAAYPQIWRDMEDAEDLKERSNRDKTLFDMGYKLTEEAVKKIYGDDYEQIQPAQPEQSEAEPEPEEAEPPKEEKPVGLKKPIGFTVPLSEPEELPPLPITPMADRMKKETREAWQEIMVHIEGLVNNAKSTAELRDALLSAYADLPTQKLTDIMALGFATAQLAGRNDVIQESERG